MSIGRRLKDLVTGVAPMIGATLGGPLGGVAMKFLADKFTGGDTGSVEDFLLSANPDTLKELKLAEIEFEKAMRELDIDLERLHAGDRASARDMAKARGLAPQIILSAIFIVGYFGIMYLLITSNLWQELADFAKGQIAVLIGVLTAGVTQIMNFFFGSSSGSKDKTKVIANGKHP